jgi:hypothetical protein
MRLRRGLNKNDAVARGAPVSQALDQTHDSIFMRAHSPTSLSDPVYEKDQTCPHAREGTQLVLCIALRVSFDLVFVDKNPMQEKFGVAAEPARTAELHAEATAQAEVRIDCRGSSIAESDLDVREFPPAPSRTASSWPVEGAP